MVRGLGQRWGKLWPDFLGFCGLRTDISGISEKDCHRDEFRGTFRLPRPPQASSICRAAIHYGILDDKGGLVDVTRNGKVPFFVKSERNGVESLR